MKKTFTFIMLITSFILTVNASNNTYYNVDLCSDYFRILAERSNKFENILGENIEFETQKKYESLVQLSGFDKQYFISTTYGEIKFYALKGTYPNIQKAEEKMYEIQRKFSECLFDYKFKISENQSIGKTIFIQNPTDNTAQSKIEIIIDEKSKQYFVALIIENRNYEIPLNAEVIGNNVFPAKIQRVLNTKFQDQIASIIDSSYNEFNGLKIKNRNDDSLNVFLCNCNIDGSIYTQINYADEAKFSAVFLRSSDEEILESKYEEIKDEIEELIRYKYPLFDMEGNQNIDENQNSKLYSITNKTKIRIGIYPTKINNDFEVRMNIY